MGIVREPVERALRQDRIVEERDPLLDCPIGGQDRRGAPVALEDHLVEVARLLGREPAQAGVVDELLVYLAPVLIGEAQGMVQLPALSDLAQAQRLTFREVTQVGEDVRILARFN